MNGRIEMKRIFSLFILLAVCAAATSAMAGIQTGPFASVSSPGGGNGSPGITNFEPNVTLGINSTNLGSWMLTDPNSGAYLNVQSSGLMSFSDGDSLNPDGSGDMTLEDSGEEALTLDASASTPSADLSTYNAQLSLFTGGQVTVTGTNFAFDGGSVSAPAFAGTNVSSYMLSGIGGTPVVTALSPDVTIQSVTGHDSAFRVQFSITGAILTGTTPTNFFGVTYSQPQPGTNIVEMSAGNMNATAINYDATIGLMTNGLSGFSVGAVLYTELSPGVLNTNMIVNFNVRRE